MSELGKILKGKIPVEYLRVSTEEQASKGGGIQSQKKMMREFLKDYKLTKKPITFTEQVSGGRNPEARPEFTKMIEFIMGQKDPSKYFVLLRDFKRWSRHTIYGPWAARVFYDNGVEIVSILDRAAVGHRKRPDANGEFLFGLWQAIGGRERTSVAEATEGGLAVAAAAGRIGGQHLDFNMPWEGLLELLPRLNLGTRDAEHIGAKATARQLRIGDSWVKKWKKRYNALEAWGKANDIPNALNEWVDTVLMIRKELDKYGPNSKPSMAIKAMTSGFVKKPEQFWSFKPSEKQLNNWASEPDKFLPKR